MPISIIFPPIEFKANGKRLIMHKPVKPMMMMSGNIDREHVKMKNDFNSLWRRRARRKIAENAL